MTRRESLLQSFDRTARAYREACLIWELHPVYGDAHAELAQIRAYSEDLRRLAADLVALDGFAAAGAASSFLGAMAR